MIARAAMPAPAPMQWKAIGRAVKSILAVRGALAVGGMLAVGGLDWRSLLLRLAAAASDERGQTLDVFLVRRLLLLRALTMTVILRLLLFARIKGLRFARRVGFADGGLVFAVVITLVGSTAALVGAWLIIGLALAKLFLGGGDQAEIVLGVLLIVFGRHGIAGTLRIACKLEILFRDMGCRSADFHVRSVGLVHARQRILVVATFAVTTAHSLVVLTVSHDLLSRQPPVYAGTNAAVSRRTKAPGSRQFDARIRTLCSFGVLGSRIALDDSTYSSDNTVFRQYGPCSAASLSRQPLIARKTHSCAQNR
jgi:hypothetical protein